jgi:O-antigen/teichoic acid export membrane protein
MASTFIRKKMRCKVILMLQLNQQQRDLFFTLVNQVWRLVSGPITLLLIPLYLSPEQQGYWYLFGSVAALSIFADMGFSNIILQFSAHEYAFLRFNSEGLLEGEKIYQKRLGSFFRFAIKWISTICAIVFPVIYAIGIYFFIRDKVLDIYLLPWTLFSIGSLIGFFNSSVLSFIQGLNKIEVIQKIGFRVAILNTVILVVTLVLGGNIYAIAFGSLVSASSMFVSIFGGFGKLLKQLLNISKDYAYSWRKEVVPFFFKYALSISSGYFIFKIYTPLMHYFHGPVYSGKVGITLALIMAVFSMSDVWIFTIIPKMNMLISQKLWPDLDRLFIKRLLLSIGTYLFISVGIFVFAALFGDFWIVPKIASRFLPGITLVMLLACYFIQLIINAWALYLRGHKQEPYVIPSVVSAVWVAVTTFFAGKYLPPTYFFVGFASSYVLATPMCYFIYKKYKGVWHGK